MPDDKVLSQADIDALVSKLPVKKSEPSDIKAEMPVNKATLPSPGIQPQPIAAQPAQPTEIKTVEPAAKSSTATPPSAQTEYDTLPARLSRLESNYVLVKKDLQAILLDLREKLLDAENPFESLPSYKQASTNPRKTDTKISESKTDSK